MEQGKGCSSEIEQGSLTETDGRDERLRKEEDDNDEQQQGGCPKSDDTNDGGGRWFGNGVALQA